MSTLKSTTLPALVLELGEIMTSNETLLTPAQDRVQITYNREGNRVKVAGTFAYTSDFAAGVVTVASTSYLADTGIVLTGTPIATLGATNLTSAMIAAVVKLSIAENNKIATGVTLPSGVGAVWTASSTNDTISIDVDLAFSRSLDTSGQPVFTVVNHVA